MSISKSVASGYRSAGTTTVDPTVQSLSSEVVAAVGSGNVSSSSPSSGGGIGFSPGPISPAPPPSPPSLQQLSPHRHRVGKGSTYWPNKPSATDRAASVTSTFLCRRVGGRGVIPGPISPAPPIELPISGAPLPPMERLPFMPSPIGWIHWPTGGRVRTGPISQRHR